MTMISLESHSEFLTENNAKEQFVTSRMRIIGGGKTKS